MPPKASTVAEYLASLPADRRQVVEGVRKFLLDHLDAKLEEGISYGMIGYAVPHRLYPNGYHCDPKLPLPYAALAAQKAHFSLHLMALNQDEDHPETKAFRDAWAKTGKKLDMGKSCIRFKKLDDLALDVIAANLKKCTADRYIAAYEANLAAAKRSTAGGSAKQKAQQKIAKAAKPTVRKAKKAVAKKVTKK